MRAVHIRSGHFNGAVIRLRDKSSSGVGLMRGIKIPQQDFALKMPGGLMREVFAGHYGNCLCILY